MTLAPDYVEPVLGWRLWHAVEDGSSTGLSSVIYRTIWPYGEPLVAECVRYRIPHWPFGRGRHEAPDARCSCGIHAATMPILRGYLSEQFFQRGGVLVIGRVSLWGVVHEHKRGWRASRAYPERLYVPKADLSPRYAARVVENLERYGVPVVMVDGHSADAVVDEVATLAAA